MFIITKRYIHTAIFPVCLQLSLAKFQLSHENTIMHVFDITLKCIIVSWFFTQKYNLLYICCLIRQPAKLLNFAKSSR